MGSTVSQCWSLCSDCPPLASPTQNSASPSQSSIPIARAPNSNSNHYSAAGNHSSHSNLPVPLLKSGGAVESASQIDFFRMLDDKIQHGPDLSEDEESMSKS